MKVSQIVALAFLGLMIGALAFSFVRHGAKLKSDRKPDSLPPGAGGYTRGDGASPSA